MKRSKPTLQSLFSISGQTCSSLKGILADIDDTITTNGYLTAQAYTAMEKVQHSNLILVLVTGRSAGWCDHIARVWPVDGVIGENGAFYFRYDREKRKLISRHITPSAELTKYNKQLNRIAKKIFQEVPGTAFASDQKYRLSDLAIDICEDVTPITEIDVKRVVKIMEEGGLCAKVSSIHVNGWFGTYNKLDMTKKFMQECFKVNLNVEKERFLFIGDSPNDEPMFRFFPNSVGVANISSYLGQLCFKPKFLTKQSFGSGFVEMANFIIENRSKSVSSDSN